MSTYGVNTPLISTGCIHIRLASVNDTLTVSNRTTVPGTNDNIKFELFKNNEFT